MDLCKLISFIASFMWLVLAVIVGIVANKRGCFGDSWFLVSA